MKDYLSEFDRFMKKRQLALRGIMDLNFAYMLEAEENIYTQDVDGKIPAKPAPAAKPEPQIPPPCWDSREISADACRAATKAMCS